MQLIMNRIYKVVYLVKLMVDIRKLTTLRLFSIISLVRLFQTITVI